MPSKLDELLKILDPTRNLDELDQRADHALNSFGAKSASVSGIAEFRALMARFHYHVTIAALNQSCPPAFDEQREWGFCLYLMEKEYGAGAAHLIYDRARSGAEGGLYAVLKEHGRRVARQYAETEISARVTHYWRALTVEEQIAAGKEYIQKHGDLLPADVRDHGAVTVRAHLPKMLELHPHLLRALRQVRR